LISRVITKYSGSSEEVIHVFPLEYSIDGIKGIKDPVSMYGSELSGDIHVITAPKSMINNIANCLGQCQLDIQGFVSSPYVCGLSCLTDDEMDMGSLLIDMGGGNTSFAVFGNKKLVFAGSLNIGSDYVTSDIALGLSISVEEAERLKVLHGSVMNHSLHSQQVINIPFTKEGDEEPFYITYAMLSIVIRARLEEILQMVCKKTSKIMDYSHYHRIVLTGGGSQIMGIKELAQQVFACAARVAGPKTSDIQFRYEKNDNVDQNPVFSTSFGMLQFAAKDLYTPLLTAGTQHAGGVIRKIIAWVKGN
jgi:cell division protein FtsA